VVEAAGAGPGGLVRLVSGSGDAWTEAEVVAEGWHPQADVAFLRLADALPESAHPVALAPAAGGDGFVIPIETLPIM
jgi:hypothetical protein